LSSLIIKHGQEGDRHLNKCGTYRSGLKRCKKQKRQKQEKKKLQPSQETLKWLFCCGSEDQRRHFCGTCKRTENQRTCCDRL